VFVFILCSLSRFYLTRKRHPKVTKADTQFAKEPANATYPKEKNEGDDQDDEFRASISNGHGCLLESASG